jgi:hypothetical protein
MGRNPDKNSSLRKLEFMPRNLDTRIPSPGLGKRQSPKYKYSGRSIVRWDFFRCSKKDTVVLHR